MGLDVLQFGEPVHAGAADDGEGDVGAGHGLVVRWSGPRAMLAR
jgi:hypothetical protein